MAYAFGQVHTNGLENFWSQLKKCLKGTHISGQPFHLAKFIDELAFRFNNRAGTDRDRFIKWLSMATGRRLKYETLISTYIGYFDEEMPKQQGCAAGETAQILKRMR